MTTRQDDTDSRGPLSGATTLRDVVSARPVLERELIHRGAVWNLVRDKVDLGRAGVVSREILDHPGAVGIVAMNSDDEVLVLKQYRHPVGRELWEVPAGLMDHENEDPLAAAKRELFEEADLRANSWHVLTDFYTSPGGTTEPLRVYLARDLIPIPEHERFERSEEELDLEYRWVALEDLVTGVLGGHLHNPTLVVGALAAFASRQGNWASLRDGSSPWLEQVTRRLIADV